jgi:hypothetical protein
MTTGAIACSADATGPGRKPGRAQLQAELECVQAEIRQYPMPIPACDAWFNHLLEERGRIADELTRLSQE